MTKLQIQWAMNHDWFVGCKRIANNENMYEVQVIDRGVIYTFIDFEFLMVWAGY